MKFLTIIALGAFVLSSDALRFTHMKKPHQNNPHI